MHWQKFKKINANNNSAKALKNTANIGELITAE
jgi:hypothetical protein